MESIYIPRLARLSEGTERLAFNEVIPDLETLTPVQGWLEVTHRGNYLEVMAEAETIVTLTCDRCLQKYNYRLKIAPSEMIWLRETEEDTDDGLILDQDIDPEDDLVESLPPQGYFDPTTWLYEQLSLELPLRRLCDAQCGGIPVIQPTAETVVDRRWASLEALKGQLPNT